MGAITRADLRADIRSDLRCWADVGVLAKAVGKTEGQIELTDDIGLDFVAGKCLIEIDSEVMLAVDKPSNTNVIRVQRAYMGTSRAEHAADAVVNIFQPWGWTDHEINNRILPVAIKWLKPHAWILARTSSLTWGTQLNDYTTSLSSYGISYPDGNILYKLQWLETGTSRWNDFYGWQLQGDQIRFRDRASQDRTFRAIYFKYQANLTDDTTALDNDDFREAIGKYGVWLALNGLKANRARFTEYAAALNDRASTPDELIRTAFDFKNQAVVCRDDKSSAKPPTQASTMRSL